MNKKIAIQITLLLILVIIIIFFYYEYFSLEKKKNLTYQDKKVEVIDSENNIIKNLEYLSTDKDGNKYLITAGYGEISNDAESVILMTNVVAQIDLFKKNSIYLTSKFARYNTINLDTNFSKDVILKYTGHKIKSNNLDLSFAENFAWIYNDIVYKSPFNQLFADKLEIDLITKDSKIFMYDDKKLKIIGK